MTTTAPWAVDNKPVLGVFIGSDPMSPHPTTLDVNADGTRTLSINTEAELLTTAAKRAGCARTTDMSQAIATTLSLLLPQFVRECDPNQDTLDAACRLVLETIRQTSNG